MGKLKLDDIDLLKSLAREWRERIKELQRSTQKGLSQIDHHATREIIDLNEQIKVYGWCEKDLISYIDRIERKINDQPVPGPDGDSRSLEYV